MPRWRSPLKLTNKRQCGIYNVSGWPFTANALIMFLDSASVPNGKNNNLGIGDFIDNQIVFHNLDPGIRLIRLFANVWETSDYFHRFLE